VVEQAVANAYTSLTVARASIEASGREVRAAQVAFDGLREEARLGARTTLDVLNAEQDLLDARASLVSAQMDETLATYVVLSSIGMLDARQLGLAVQIYDPAAYYNLVRNAPSGSSEQGRALDRVLEAIGR
jgi:outer membrane protein